MWRLLSWFKLGGLVFLGICKSGMTQVLPSAGFRVISSEELIQFKSVDRMVITMRIEREALTQQGAQQLTKDTYGFNAALEQIELLDAFTLKKSGVKIPLAKEGISSQKGFVSSGVGVTMPEWQVQQITFASLEVGDKTVLQTRRTIHKAPLAGWLSHSGYLWPAQEIQNAHWRIEAPEGLHLHVRSSMLRQLALAPEAGVQVWEFDGHTKAKPIDHNPTSTRVSVPYVLVSTIKQHEEVAQLFARQVQDKAIVTDEVKVLAAQIIRGKSDDLAKTRAIYDWVRKNLKYTAIYMANGGWEPHDTTHILNTRYGDCKDHVTLMYALLKEASIPAEPVLINTNAEFAADPLPVAGAYNHTILYIPSLQKYLDPTASEIPFDGATWTLAGRPVARSDGKQASIDRTPVIQSKHNTSVVHTTMTIAADGTAKMLVQHDVTGISAAAMQERLANFPNEFKSTEVNRVLSSAGWSGSGTFTYPRVDKDVWQQSTRWDVSIHDFLQDASAGSINVHPGLNINSHISTYMGSYAQEKRDFGSQCGAYSVKESFYVSFDPRFKILRIPKPIELLVPGIQFKSVLELKGQVMQGSRELRFENDSAECTSLEYSRRRIVMQQIARHLRSPVLFMQPEL